MRFLLLGVAITLLVGCGQKGPLYLRDKVALKKEEQ